MNEVFLDTSFVIALSSITDQNHARAVKLANTQVELLKMNESEKREPNLNPSKPPYTQASQKIKSR